MSFYTFRAKPTFGLCVCYFNIFNSETVYSIFNAFPVSVLFKYYVRNDSEKRFGNAEKCEYPRNRFQQNRFYLYSYFCNSAELSNLANEIDCQLVSDFFLAHLFTRHFFVSIYIAAFSFEKNKFSFRFIRTSYELRANDPKR